MVLADADALKLPAVMVGLLVTALGGLIAYVFYDLLRRRTRIVPYAAYGDRYRHQFSELYCELVPPGQQVPPGAITDAARQWSSFRWPLSRAVTFRPGGPLVKSHLLLALQQGRVVGFLNALVHETEGYVYIAYIGVTPHTSAERGEISRALMQGLARDLRRSPKLTHILYEITPPTATSSSSAARVRLFTDYARRFGLTTVCAPFPYIQPDLEADALDGESEADADLLVVVRSDLAYKCSAEEYLRLVRSLYFDIYLPSLSQTLDDIGRDRYAQYLEDLHRLLGESL